MSEVHLEPVDDLAAWTGPELAARDDWIHRLSAGEIAELDTALAGVAGREAVSVGLSEFPLPTLSARLAQIRNVIDQGLGVTVIKGLPVERYTEQDAAMALWGLGLHVGVPQPQDAAGALLHHVRDTGARVETDPNIRIYQTNGEQSFHNDGGDLVMLLCRRTAKTGGRSRMAGAPALFNLLLSENPEFAKALQAPFHFDARGQSLPGRPATQIVPVFTWHDGRVSTLYKRPYITLAQRFNEIPRLTELQTAALDRLDALCEDEAVHHAFYLQPGDIQIANNFAVLHARDPFDDFDEPDQKRHMIRLWLGLPEGRTLPECYRETREFGPLFDLRGQ
ncbi:MAG: TauD/TfdA family dioxygenase [Rhodospirillaceae bacterium]|nr:TauD/TfdA family dioxygenase [Rhodospirillaceae bacterium]MBT6138915.1 TauD/TfdA family dioxygenase [Rhodospirillaceae bacterium]